MANLVKPGMAVQDKRSDDERRKALVQSTGENLLHMQEQLVKHGHSVEQVLAAAARAHFGVVLSTTAPKPDAEAA
jgi:hypothetical protein